MHPPVVCEIVTKGYESCLIDTQKQSSLPSVQICIYFPFRKLFFDVKSLTSGSQREIL